MPIEAVREPPLRKLLESPRWRPVNFRNCGTAIGKEPDEGFPPLGEVAEDPSKGRAIRLPQCPACRPGRHYGK
jgi:hypothetical protein